MEIIGGLWSNSLALLSDSAHMISDVLALGLSMLALHMASRPSNSRFTFGYLRFEIIASFLNGLSLIVIALGIAVEGVRRLFRPEPIDFGLMLTVASIGLAVNIALTAALSRSARKEGNLNLKSALWHFIGDLISSIGVIVSALLIRFTGLTWFDPIISLVIGGIIMTGGAKIVRESYLYLMEAVPDTMKLEEIRADIGRVAGVRDVHDMHLWAISTDHYSLTAHVFVEEKVPPFLIVGAVNEMLRERYGILHATIQIEHAAFHDHGEYGKKFLQTSAT
ncbi:cation diffusion facilitator family transporter [Paenibacillus thermoaerophilus]